MVTRNKRYALERAFADLGDLLERQDDRSDSRHFEEYEDEPIRFIREVTGGAPWPKQEEIALAVRDEAQVTVRSCHAAGKDWLAARLALWWCYAREGLVILTGPTAAQVEEILMRREVRQAFLSGDLPGELHVKALRPSGEGQAGILAKTAAGVSALTGFHEARVLFIITEAQDPEIVHAWDAAFACATGEGDRILTLGNPVEKGGRFYRAHRPASGWRSFRISGADIPNVREGETVIPGLLTRAGVARFAREYGEDSGFYLSRVHAEFPEEAEEGVFQRSWLEAAAERWRNQTLEGEAEHELHLAALDPSRSGPNASVLATRQGPVLREIIVKGGRQEGPELRDHILQSLGARGLGAEKGELAALLVDEVGVGGFILDLLAEAGVPVLGFNGGRTPRDPTRYVNVRAESYWRLRVLLQRGRVALPPDEELFEELMALRWRPSADGRVQLEAKKDASARLGRSPDRADAVSMVFYVDAPPREPDLGVVQPRRGEYFPLLPEEEIVGNFLG